MLKWKQSKPLKTTRMTKLEVRCVTCGCGKAITKNSLVIDASIDARNMYHDDDDDEDKYYMHSFRLLSVFVCFFRVFHLFLLILLFCTCTIFIINKYHRVRAIYCVLNSVKQIIIHEPGTGAMVQVA